MSSAIDICLFFWCEPSSSDLRAMASDDVLEATVEVLAVQRLKVAISGFIRTFGEIAVVVRGCVYIQVGATSEGRGLVFG
jgi:hypothetical protein